jgi:hypothetical protein
MKLSKTPWLELLILIGIMAGLFMLLEAITPLIPSARGMAQVVLVFAGYGLLLWWFARHREQIQVDEAIVREAQLKHHTMPVSDRQAHYRLVVQENELLRRKMRPARDKH